MTEGLAGIAQLAREKGQQRIEAGGGGFRERLARAREGIQNVVQRGREVAGRVAGAVRTMAEITVGATDPQVRKELAGYLGDKANDAREGVADRMSEIRQNVNDKKEAAIQFTTDRLTALRTAARERVVEPAVNGARTVGRAVRGGAETAGLFAVAAGVGAGMAVVEGGRAVGRGAATAGVMAYEGGRWAGGQVARGARATYEAGGRTYERGREWSGRTAEQAGDAARRWGNRFTDWRREMANRAQTNVQNDVLSARAAYNEARAGMAARGEAKAGAKAERARAKAENLSLVASRKAEEARMRNDRANNLRRAGNELRVNSANGRAATPESSKAVQG